jgi:hypothetical protein
LMPRYKPHHSHVGIGGGCGMGAGGGGGLAMSAAMAGMPIAAANKAAVMAFFIIFLPQFALTIPDFIISPYLQGCTRATQTGDIAGWLTGSALLRVGPCAALGATGPCAGRCTSKIECHSIEPVSAPPYEILWATCLGDHPRPACGGARDPERLVALRLQGCRRVWLGPQAASRPRVRVISGRTRTTTSQFHN